MVRSLENNQLPADGGVSVLAFSAKWCPPCKVMNPIYEEAAARFPGMTFLKADHEKVPELFERFGVQTVPTYLVLKGQEVLHRQVGALPSSKFQAMLGNYA
jgi:thioredoxin 1